MSSERRWDQRRFKLEESSTQNDGARTVFIEHLTPGTTVPPHYHNRFSETFDLISGSMQVFTTDEPDLAKLEASPQDLEIGKEVTVEPGRYHQYKVGITENNVLRCTVAPGDADFERLLMIMNGLGRDGRLEEHGDSVVLMAVIMELSDAHLIGPAKEMLDGVRREHGAEILQLKGELLSRYDNDDSVRALMAMS